jgi:hypothetical protein
LDEDLQKTDDRNIRLVARAQGIAVVYRYRGNRAAGSDDAVVGNQAVLHQRIVRTGLDLERETSRIDLVLSVAQPLGRGMG